MPLISSATKREQDDQNKMSQHHRNINMSPRTVSQLFKKKKNPATHKIPVIPDVIFSLLKSKLDIEFVELLALALF